MMTKPWMQMMQSYFNKLDPMSAGRAMFIGMLQCLVGAVGLSGLLGCHDLTTQSLPAGTSDPSVFNTPTGAIGMRNAAILSFEVAIPGYLVNTGLLTDELGAFNSSLVSSGASWSLDVRVVPEIPLCNGSCGAQTYIELQNARSNIAQALGALAAYDTTRADTALVKIRRSELYALAGYTDLLLADFFCSGVPLSTLDFQQDFTYHASSTTAEVYHAASVNADSAMALRTSDSVLTLARVVKGRALLGLDSAAAAAQVVAGVPNGSQYRLAVHWNPTNDGNSADNYLTRAGTVSDREGENGLPFLSSADPRTTVTTLVPAGGQISSGGNISPIALTFPTKYNPLGFSPVPLADWIEARLIQAEAALRANPNNATWLTILNILRATAPIPGTTQAATLQQLPTLTDPGSSPGESARVSLLFQERAYWLFLTGHRQGDLRRLIRQYGRRQDQVYPIGLYNGQGLSRYGTDVTAPIPSVEDANPLFHGCLNRDA